MTQPTSFAVTCYQTNYLNPSVTPPVGMIDRLSEHLKPVARCIYMLAVSTLIAPTGIIYHLCLATKNKIQSYRTNDTTAAQELSERAWIHFTAAGKDSHAFLKDSFFSFHVIKSSIAAIQILNLGVRSNNLALTVIGLGCLGFTKLLMDELTHLPQAWKSLVEVKKSIEENNWKPSDRVLVFIDLFQSLKV